MKTDPNSTILASLPLEVYLQAVPMLLLSMLHFSGDVYPPPKRYFAAAIENNDKLVYSAPIYGWGFPSRESD